MAFHRSASGIGRDLNTATETMIEATFWNQQSPVYVIGEAAEIETDPLLGFYSKQKVNYHWVLTLLLLLLLSPIRRQFRSAQVRRVPAIKRHSHVLLVKGCNHGV